MYGFSSLVVRVGEWQSCGLDESSYPCRLERYRTNTYSQKLYQYIYDITSNGKRQQSSISKEHSYSAAQVKLFLFQRRWLISLSNISF